MCFFWIVLTNDKFSKVAVEALANTPLPESIDAEPEFMRMMKEGLRGCIVDLSALPLRKKKKTKQLSKTMPSALLAEAKCGYVFALLVSCQQL